MPPRPRRAVACGALALALLMAGCGGSSDEGTPAISSGGPPGEGGTLVWAVADRVVSADPLEASTRAEQIAARQVNEPLTGQGHGSVRSRAPGGRPGARRRGARTTTRSGPSSSGPESGSRTARPSTRRRSSPTRTRWRTTAAGRAALPGLLAVDAPRPDEVRFVLSAPDPDFPGASPPRGSASFHPRALEPSTGEGAFVGRSLATGTGAVRDPPARCGADPARASHELVGCLCGSRPGPCARPDRAADRGEPEPKTGSPGRRRRAAR